MNVCPCCKQQLPESQRDIVFYPTAGTIARNGAFVQLTEMEYKIATLLYHARPVGLAADTLVERVYLNGDLPLSADKCVHVVVCRLRKLIAPLKLTITKADKYHPYYQLETT